MTILNLKLVIIATTNHMHTMENHKINGMKKRASVGERNYERVVR